MSELSLVEDCELRSNGGRDVENRFENPFIMQDVLGPAVADPGHDAEKILHRERETSPVMGLHLRHRHNEIGL